MARQINLPKSELERLYWDEGMTYQEIADYLGVSFCCIQNNFNRYGIERRTKTEHFIGKKRPEHGDKIREAAKRGAYKNIGIRGSDNHLWTGGIKHLGDCEYCGKPIHETESRRGRRFCSIKCSRADGRFNGEANPNWKGGISFEPYPETFNRTFKRLIRARDGKCMKCGALHGMKTKSGCQNLCVHHIDYNKANTTKQNCIALCHSCNSKVNSDRFYWEKYFRKMVHDLYGY